MEARHLVVHDGDADRVVAAGNVTMEHGNGLLLWLV
jgi:phosphomannomutase